MALQAASGSYSGNVIGLPIRISIDLQTDGGTNPPVSEPGCEHLRRMAKEDANTECRDPYGRYQHERCDNALLRADIVDIENGEC
ncbi:uncharacterized protein N7500_002005 [Penicillium coprophilum]|uniref:uncharacterized protein n=1 Tax=Penicillium coprophilum TaxID=36646 RepID=UPI002389F8D3|nr:uncharacterized protein N7500_002005 [Penicillium coprophilum]KAJ5174074.1 hypothetical protein N7500_002005 [Penicillium coprophilum]